MDLIVDGSPFFAPRMRAELCPVEDGACALDGVSVSIPLKGARLSQFVAGRRAAHALVGAPVLSDGDGAPIFPAGWAGSIAHTARVAIAVAAPAGEWTLGVDIEELSPPRSEIAGMILGADDPKPAPGDWIALLRIFCVKEALYKALYPRVRRFVDFPEAAVRAPGDGPADVTLSLECGRTFVVEAASVRLGDQMLAWARVRS